MLLNQSGPRSKRLGGDTVRDELRDIVVVDDDPTLLSMLSDVFNEDGYTVRTAADGFAALAAIRDRIPDILVSDLNMPRMSGFELLSVVRRRFPAIIVIAMSGAYAGSTLPPGVEADGFYAKGWGSVFGLLDLLHNIGNEDVRQSRRAVVHTWISGPALYQCDSLTIGVACPECLRVFSHAVTNEPAQLQDSRCPHCQQSLQLAIADQLAEASGAAVKAATSPLRSTNAA
jgi:CheY-like chemotaxis protein